MDLKSMNLLHLLQQTEHSKCFYKYFFLKNVFTLACHGTMLEAFWHPLLANCRRQAEINLHNDYEDGFTVGATRQLGLV